MFSVTSNLVGSAYGQIYWILVLQPITVHSVTLFDVPQLYFLNNATYLPYLLLLTGFSYRHIGLASQPPLFIAANSSFVITQDYTTGWSVSSLLLNTTSKLYNSCGCEPGILSNTIYALWWIG